MKIAICDDELSSIQEIRSLLTHWAVRHDLSFTLYQYSNGDDLLLALKTYFYGSDHSGYYHAVTKWAGYSQRA